MQLDALKTHLPDYARDLRVNLGQIEAAEHLTDDQTWGTVLAVALAARNPLLLRAAEHEATQRLAPETAAAARTAAALMGMNNIYYRFVHLSSNPGYGKLPARLRIQALANHGADEADFELWSLAVSAVNGCGLCIDSHERKLRQAGVSEATIQDAVRVAAILHAVAAVLDAAEQTAAA